MLRSGLKTTATPRPTELRGELSGDCSYVGRGSANASPASKQTTANRSTLIPTPPWDFRSVGLPIGRRVIDAPFRRRVNHRANRIAGMSQPVRPQAREMADESMVRNLAAQAEAIWPQERPIFLRHDPGEGRVLDVGCGTGEMTARLAETFPRATCIGIDVEEPHLERPRQRCAAFGARVRFETGDALDLAFDDETFDLVVCRHVIQAVSDAARVLSEIKRVLRPGGRAHVIAEDYGMLHCYPTELDADGFWQRFPPRH